MSPVRNPARLLGDVNAESDDLLERAFYKSQDYKTLIEHPAATIVVGRRGAGKSALAIQLCKQWQSDKKARLVGVFPDEVEIIALRSIGSIIGEEYTHARAVFRILWRHALAMEALAIVRTHYKLHGKADAAQTTHLIDSWASRGKSLLSRLRSLAQEHARTSKSTQELISSLSDALDWTSIKLHLATSLQDSHLRLAIVVDRIDEGYLPDAMGTALVAGLATALLDLDSSLRDMFACLMLRDNIARALAMRDPDYSRSLESRVLRIHWDEANLYNFAIERLRAVIGTSEGEDRDIWNGFVTNDLAGRPGFKRCLRYTLYRPRDVLLLLNQAHYHAHKAGNSRISTHDLNATAGAISANRLQDLFREYESACPSLEVLTRALAGGNPVLSRQSLDASMRVVLENDTYPPKVQQDLQVVGSPNGASRVLYQFGVIGAQDKSSGEFAFCHDGHEVDERLADAVSFLVHPCYWMALGLSETSPGIENGEEEIFDDYDIAVFSHSADQRKSELGRLAMQVRSIAPGIDASADFEDWCFRAIQIAFAGSLRGVSLKPNAQAPNRRDIVGRNVGDEPVWKDLRERYDCTQVVFEIKNYEDITPDDFRQLGDYLHDHYGRAGFIVCRQSGTDLRRGPILDRVRDIWANHRKLVVILDDGFLKKALEKARSPKKYDAPSLLLERVVDKYEKLYVHGQPAESTKRRSKGIANGSDDHPDRGVS